MGMNAIVLIVIASFAVDRVVGGILFMLSFNRRWRVWFPAPLTVDEAARPMAERRLKLIYFTLAGIIGTAVLAYFGQVRVLLSLGVPAKPAFDVIVTGLVLMGGADKVADLLKLAQGKPNAGAAASPRPLEITGTLTLQQPGTPLLTE